MIWYIYYLFFLDYVYIRSDINYIIELNFNDYKIVLEDFSIKFERIYLAINGKCLFNYLYNINFWYYIYTFRLYN